PHHHDNLARKPPQRFDERAAMGNRVPVRPCQDHDLAGRRGGEMCLRPDRDIRSRRLRHAAAHTRESPTSEPKSDPKQSEGPCAPHPHREWLAVGLPHKVTAGATAGLQVSARASWCALPPGWGQKARLCDLAPGGWGAEYSEAVSRTGPRGNDQEVA